MLAFLRDLIAPSSEARRELEKMQSACLALLDSRSVDEIRSLAPDIGAYSIPAVGEEKRVGRWTLGTAAFVWRGEGLFVHAQAQAEGGILPGKIVLIDRVLEIEDSGTVRELDNREAEARSVPTW